MTSETANRTKPQRPLRLWPGVLIVALQWLGRFVVPQVFPEANVFGVLGGLAGGLAVVVWWAFFSRAPGIERWSAVALMIAALLVTSQLIDPSLATGGMGMLFPIYAVPVLSLAFVAWAVLSRNLPDRTRRVTMVATIVLSCLVWTVVRTGGFTSDMDSDFAWRWGQTAEDRLVAQAAGEPVVPSTALATVAESEAAWPAFRGPGRNGAVSGVRIETDWSASPPVELWRRPVGPGWSSFAVQGDLLYTQEQRGEDEAVSCYRLSTGEPVWRHSDAARFWESNAGAGPRGTPTLSAGRVYTLGGTGIVNALDALDGAVVWSRDAAADAKAELPYWGFSGSPLVVGDLVVVAASGTLVAYDVATGEPRWFGPAGGASYSSPQLLTIDGVEQILMVNESGVIGVAPADGALLWEHEWPGYPIVIPARTADGDVLVVVSESSGTRRLSIARGAAGWTVDEVWTSTGLKPYYSDLVVHEGHAYGFDGNILASIALEDGERQWKGGRYGAGQLLLLADQDLLLVLSQKGELILVGATADEFAELARLPAIEGKTWNHPVLAGDVLLVRNGAEMVAFRLAQE